MANIADTSIYTDPTNMEKDNIQLLIWNGTKWVELSNGLTINKINENIGAIQDAVEEAQIGITTAENNSQNAVDKANSAIAQSTANSQDITTVKADITKAQSDISTVSNDLDTTKTNLQTVSDEATKNGSDIKDIQTDTTSIKFTLANTQGDVTRLQQTATTMQSDIKDNADNISSVTQTASGLSTDIKNAQGDITTLKSTASGLSTTVASVQTQVNNSSTGTNLLVGTGIGENYPTLPNASYASSNSSILIDASSGLVTVQAPSSASSEFNYRFNDPGGNKEMFGLIAGQTYTISGLAVVYNGVLKFRYQYWNSGKWNDASDSISPDLLVGNSDGVTLKKFSYTFTIPSNATGIYISFQAYNFVASNSHFSFRNMKLELGSVATDYLANPADNATVTALSSVKQEADSISSTVTANKASSDSQFSTINQTISGIQSTVSNKADSSTVTQLATLVNSKVNSSDYNSEITQLASDINLRVKTGDLLSQINQQAGGDTLIQVSSGKGKLYLDASSVVFGGTAFITSAMISSISADDITTGTMTAGAINLGNGTFKVDTKGNLTSSNAAITGGSLKVGSNFSVNTNGILTASGATINGNLNVNSSGNLTTIDSNGFHNYDGDGNDIYIKNGTFKSTMYDEAYNATTSIEVQEGKLVAAYNDENISIYVGRQTAPVILWSDGSQIESSSGSLAVNSDKDMELSSASGNLTLQSNGKFNVNAMDGTSILSFDTYASSGWIYANNLLWAKTALRTSYLWVEGKADISGVVNCQSVNQTSLLSKKTNITKLNIQDVINAVNSTEIYEYSFKRDLEQGVNKRYASYIIDDVNEVAQYNEPSEFLSEDKQGRDDGTQLAYLTLMVQEMYKEIQELKNK
ncbi:MAG: hypothetical protein ABF991_05430 [Liquorilactobacillus hordei]|uniref:hypothetical protein n=1 Tax=Liquorilactobacillus hordei TaxID=468911 RepID=UPI0039E99E56